MTLAGSYSNGSEQITGKSIDSGNGAEQSSSKKKRQALEMDSVLDGADRISLWQNEQVVAWAAEIDESLRFPFKKKFICGADLLEMEEDELEDDLKITDEELRFKVLGEIHRLQEKEDMQDLALAAARGQAESFGDRESVPRTVPALTRTMTSKYLSLSQGVPLLAGSEINNNEFLENRDVIPKETEREGTAGEEEEDKFTDNLSEIRAHVLYLKRSAAWTVGEVLAWLHIINADGAIPSFEENQICGADLFELTEDELREDLEIEDDATRKTVLRGINMLRLRYCEVEV